MIESTIDFVIASPSVFHNLKIQKKPSESKQNLIASLGSLSFQIWIGFHKDPDHHDNFLHTNEKSSLMHIPHYYRTVCAFSSCNK